MKILFGGVRAVLLTRPAQNISRKGSVSLTRMKTRQAQDWFWLFLLLNPLNAPWIFAAAACTSGSVRSMSVKCDDY